MSADRWEGGGLSPEEAERLASKFKPMWEAETLPEAVASPAETSSPAAAEPLPTSGPAAPSSPISVTGKETLLGVPAPVLAEPIEAPASAHEASLRDAEPAKEATVAAAPARIPADDPLPSIVINAEAMQPPRAEDPSSFENEPVVPMTSRGGFGKGLYVGLGIGAAAVIAAVLLSSSGTKSKPAESKPPEQTSTASVEPVPQPPEIEAAKASASASPAASAQADDAAPSPPVLPAALPLPPEPAKVVPTETAAPPPKSAPATPPRTAPAAAPRPASTQKPPPAAAPKPTQPPAAPAKPRNAAGGSAIVRDTPF